LSIAGTAGAIRFEVMRHIFLLALLALSLNAEMRTLTLRQAVDLALEQNPDLMLARLDQQKSALAVGLVAEPLLPRVYAGSGLAYTYGFPVSLDGSAPSIFQARAERSIYNAPARLATAQAKEQARGAVIGSESVKEEVALKTAVLFLDLERTVRSRSLLQRQVESLTRIEAAVRLRVAEGRELPIEGKRAAVNLARARQRLSALEGSAASLSRSLAQTLGLPAAATIEPAMEERASLGQSIAENELIQESVRGNAQLRKLESDLKSQTLAARMNRAKRLPSVNLIAQYSLLGKFNNYEDFFRRFQRHNAQIGASIMFPLFANPQDEAAASQAGVEARKLRIQAESLRARIEAGARESLRNVADAEAYQEVAKLDLEVAREQVSILLSLTEEGRAGTRQLEEARVGEQEKWAAYHQALYELERARLEALRHSGQLIASMRR
jgi:outer membrane protein TolC